MSIHIHCAASLLPIRPISEKVYPWEYIKWEWGFEKLNRSYFSLTLSINCPRFAYVSLTCSVRICKAKIISVVDPDYGRFSNYKYVQTHSIWCRRVHKWCEMTEDSCVKLKREYRSIQDYGSLTVVGWSPPKYGLSARKILIDFKSLMAISWSSSEFFLLSVFRHIASVVKTKNRFLQISGVKRLILQPNIYPVSACPFPAPALAFSSVILKYSIFQSYKINVKVLYA